MPIHVRVRIYISVPPDPPAVNVDHGRASLVRKNGHLFRTDETTPMASNRPTLSSGVRGGATMEFAMDGHLFRTDR